MKRLLQTLMLGMMVAAFALPSFAQDTASQPAQSEQDAQTAVYKQFTDAYNRGRTILTEDPNLAKPGNKEAYAQANKDANQYAMEYVQKWPNATGPIPDYLKKFIANYEKLRKEARKTELAQLLKDKKYDQVFTLGKEILADEPNDLYTHYALVQAGYSALEDRNKNFSGQTIAYAKKGIQLVESGQTYIPNQPLKADEKDKALGLFNYALGLATIDDAPADAIGAFIKVASIEGGAKKDARTYVLLARAYQSAEYTKLATDYGAQCKTEEQTSSPTCMAMKERLNLVVDRIIDAYARAISFSGTDPNYASLKPDWMKTLTDLYKYRHEGKDDGLTQYIAGVTSQPLPGPLPPAGAMPAPTSSTPAPSTTSAVSTGSNTAMTPGTTATTTPTTTAPKSTTTTTTAPKPTTKTTPKKAHAGRH